MERILVGLPVEGVEVRGLPVRGPLGLDADQLTAVAREYRANYLVLEPSQAWQESAYVAEGWTVVLRPFNSVKNIVIKAPWA